eukprot:CAMPEP_0180194518 /NCGR_PEP_ID=MMETSP0987-20121128/3085_1 /TAXON_ID=697907 /ORGANISM="non described non described, Strain CCMP2293" /LENGTH=34 /DNA_ID= /DNA_START= /DNA_END= /DNA_ORIENTATION=
MWNPPSGYVSGSDGDRAGHFNCDYRSPSRLLHLP